MRFPIKIPDIEQSKMKKFSCGDINYNLSYAKIRQIEDNTKPK